MTITPLLILPCQWRHPLGPNLEAHCFFDPLLPCPVSLTKDCCVCLIRVPGDSTPSPSFSDLPCAFRDSKDERGRVMKRPWCVAGFHTPGPVTLDECNRCTHRIETSPYHSPS
jgi:hypothetical protein